MHKRSFIFGALGGLLLGAVLLVALDEAYRSTRTQLSYDVYSKGWYLQ